MAEQVLFAREVLVEGNAGAAGDAGDGVDAATVIAAVGEGDEGGVEDSLAGALAAFAEARLVGVGRAAHRVGP